LNKGIVSLGLVIFLLFFINPAIFSDNDTYIPSNFDELLELYFEARDLAFEYRDLAVSYKQKAEEFRELYYAEKESADFYRKLYEQEKESNIILSQRLERMEDVLLESMDEALKELRSPNWGVFGGVSLGGNIGVVLGLQLEF